MTAYLATGFDLARLGTMKCAVDDGTNSGTATVTPGTYCHTSLASLAATSGYAGFPAAVDSALDAVLTANGVTVTFSTTTLRYTVTTTEANMVLDFRSATLGDDSGQRLAAALGFNYQHATATGGSASDPYDVIISTSGSPVGNVAPYYCLGLSRDGVTDYSRPFETPGQTVRQVSSNANAYSIGPATYEKRWNGRLRFQTLASVFASEADDTVAPWTYEDLLAHARCHEPVLLHHSGEATDMVFKFIDAEFSDESRSPVWSNYHAKWDLKIGGQYLGRV